MKKNKTILLSLTILFTIFGITDCVRKKDTKTKLVLYMAWSNATDPNKSVIRNLVSRFEKEHPAYTVQVSEMNRQNWGKILSMIGSGEQIDLFELSPAYVYQFYKKGVIHDLTEFFLNNSDISLNDFYPRIRQLMEIDGKIMVFPKGCQTSGIFYNQDMFNHYGLPVPDDNFTWEMCFSAAKKITGIAAGKGEKIYGLGGNPLASYFIGSGYTMPVSCLFPVNQERKKMLVDDPEVMQKAQYIYDRAFLQDKVCPSPQDLQDTSVPDLFMSQKIAMDIKLSFQQAVYAREIAAKFNWDCAPVPRNAQGERICDFYSHCWIMSAYTKYPDAAWELMKTIGGYEGAKKFVSRGIDLPIYPRQDITDAYLKNYPMPPGKKIFLDAISYITVRPFYQAEIQGMRELNNEVSHAILKEKQVIPVLKLYQKRYQKCLDDFREEYFTSE